MGRYIADFYCADARLCIEVDGDSHAEPDQADYDDARTSALEAGGFRVIRFANRDIFRDLEGVLETITQACKALAARPHSNLSRSTPQQSRSIPEGSGGAP